VLLDSERLIEALERVVFGEPERKK